MIFRIVCIKLNVGGSYSLRKQVLCILAECMLIHICLKKVIGKLIWIFLCSIQIIRRRRVYILIWLIRDWTGPIFGMSKVKHTANHLILIPWTSFWDSLFLTQTKFFDVGVWLIILDSSLAESAFDWGVFENSLNLVFTLRTCTACTISHSVIVSKAKEYFYN